MTSTLPGKHGLQSFSRLLTCSCPVGITSLDRRRSTQLAEQEADSVEKGEEESPKRFWAFVRAKSKSRSLPTDVHLNGTVVQSAPDKANMFNDYFFSTFSAPDPNVIKPDIDMFGFGGNLLAWFTSYLTDRRQRVVVEGCQSKWLPSRKLMSLVEGVQRRATKFILGAHSNTLTYKERLSTLGLLPLAHRREVCDVMTL
ncbi:hypothetical protein Bbelb_154240 [Branchiostoma belcheri]|nr:hypothetical protein Bbelb_154240 [Branchiostoma belcheri]